MKERNASDPLSEVPSEIGVMFHDFDRQEIFFFGNKRAVLGTLPYEYRSFGYLSEYRILRSSLLWNVLDFKEWAQLNPDDIDPFLQEEDRFLIFCRFFLTADELLPVGQHICERRMSGQVWTPQDFTYE